MTLVGYQEPTCLFQGGTRWNIFRFHVDFIHFHVDFIHVELFSFMWDRQNCVWKWCFV